MPIYKKGFRNIATKINGINDDPKIEKLNYFNKLIYTEIETNPENIPLILGIIPKSDNDKFHFKEGFFNDLFQIMNNEYGIGRSKFIDLCYESKEILI